MLADDLKNQIERILRWESSEYWRLRDFTHLSHSVMAYTNGWIEPQDLQQFWQSSEQATPALLNTLAQFADYADWNDFCVRNQVGEMVPVQPGYFHAPLRSIPAPWILLLCCLAVAASILVSACLIWKR